MFYSLQLDDNVVVDMVGKLVSGCLCDCEQNVLHTKDNPATSYVLNTHAAFPRKTLSAGLRNCEVLRFQVASLYYIDR